MLQLKPANASPDVLDCSLADLAHVSLVLKHDSVSQTTLDIIASLYDEMPVDSADSVSLQMAELSQSSRSGRERLSFSLCDEPFEVCAMSAVKPARQRRAISDNHEALDSDSDSDGDMGDILLDALGLEPEFGPNPRTSESEPASGSKPAAALRQRPAQDKADTGADIMSDIHQLEEAEEAHTNISAAASSAHMEQHKDNPELRGHDYIFDSAHARSEADHIFNIAELEEESWMQQVLLGRNMQSASVSVQATRGGSSAPKPSLLPHTCLFAALDTWKSSTRLTSESFHARTSGLQSKRLGQDKEMSLCLRLKNGYPIHAR